MATKMQSSLAKSGIGLGNIIALIIAATTHPNITGVADVAWMILKTVLGWIYIIVGFFIGY